MAFTPDTASQAGKKSSRRGKGNKDLEPIRTAFRHFVENNLAKIQKNFDKLDDKDKLYFILNMAEFCIPKLQRTELDIDGENFQLIGFNYALPNPNGQANSKATPSIPEVTG